MSHLKANAFPVIGKKPIATLTLQHILVCLEKVEDRGRNDLARRVRQMIGQIMRYAVTTGRAELDVTPELKGA